MPPETRADRNVYILGAGASANAGAPLFNTGTTGNFQPVLTRLTSLLKGRRFEGWSRTPSSWHGLARR